MKRLLMVFFLIWLVAGCGRVVRSEFMQHDTMYKNWDHTAFSWFGYRNPTAQDHQKTIEQNWWGIEIPYVPGQ